MDNDDVVVPPPEDVFSYTESELKSHEEGSQNYGCGFLIASILCPPLIPVFVVVTFMSVGNTASRLETSRYKKLRSIVLDDIDDDIINEKNEIYRNHSDYPKVSKQEWLDTLERYCLKYKTDQLSDEMRERIDTIQNHEHQNTIGWGIVFGLGLLPFLPPVGMLILGGCLFLYVTGSNESDDDITLQRKKVIR